jgi:hypothetical protein
MRYIFRDQQTSSAQQRTACKKPILHVNGATAEAETVACQKEGSKQRRKRKLSEDALAEEKVNEEDRQAASQLLQPPTRTPKKTAAAEEEAVASSACRQSFSCSEDEDEENNSEEKEESDDDSSSPSVLSSMDSSAFHHHDPTTESDKDKDMKQLRRRLRIRVSGTMVPDPIMEFKHMSVDKMVARAKDVVCKNIEASAYKNPTAIQMQAIPAALQRRDVLGIAPTGSGKTAAFVIPMLLLLRWDYNSNNATHVQTVKANKKNTAASVPDTNLHIASEAVHDHAVVRKNKH